MHFNDYGTVGLSFDWRQEVGFSLRVNSVIVGIYIKKANTLYSSIKVVVF